MKMKAINSLSLLAIIILAACQSTPTSTFDQAYDEISEASINQRIKALSSDAFLGRKPFTEGETITINYLKDEFEAMGLEPGNGESYFQEAPMVELTAEVSETMRVKGGKAPFDIKFWDDFVALTRRVTPTIDITDSELVFAGYGIIAPEYDWNDYENIDVKGKTVVVLINDPGFGMEDKSFFKGNEMTYYGRWTYKYEEAARQGAEACIIIHATAQASYPFQVVQGGWTGANLYLEDENNNMSRCAIEGWVSQEAAQAMFANMGKAGYDYYEEARRSDFEGFAMDQSVTMNLSNAIKKDQSTNVIAKLTGSERPDEVIIYSAHWDHFGIGAPIDGDSIYNGAVDNGSGVAGIMEVAQAFTRLGERPARTMVFMAVTAEEQGLLGSEYYSANPIYDPAKTVANLNVDAIRAIGRVNDFSVVGYGQSELEDYAEVAVKRQGRYITPDPHPEAGAFFRSDHFNFAKIGIPALYGKGAVDSDANGKEWGEKQYSDYTANRYHKPSDEYTEDFNSEGIRLDTQVLFEIGHTLSSETTFPKWKEGSEFKAIREEAASN